MDWGQISESKSSFFMTKIWTKILQSIPMCMASLTLIFMRSVGTLQPTRPLGWVGSKFNWQTDDQCQRTPSKCVFVFIPHLKSKYSHSFLSKLSRKLAIFPQRLLRLCIVWCALSGPRNWTLRDWSRAWPTLTWLAKLVVVAIRVPAFEIQIFLTFSS